MHRMKFWRQPALFEICLLRIYLNVHVANCLSLVQHMANLFVLFVDLELAWAVGEMAWHFAVTYLFKFKCINYYCRKGQIGYQRKTFFRFVWIGIWHKDLAAFREHLEIANLTNIQLKRQWHEHWALSISREM